MKRIIRVMHLILLFPLISIALLLISDRLTKPGTVGMGESERGLATTYIDSDNLYKLTGEMRIYPGTVSSADELRYNDDYYILNSLEDVHTEQFLVNGSYEATVSFAIKMHANAEYAMWFPADFLEYRVFANDELVASSKSFGSDNPPYGSNFYVDLPKTASGIYHVVLSVRTPANYVNTGKSDIFIGDKKSIEYRYEKVNMVNLVAASVIIFHVIYALIQMLSPRSRVYALIFFPLATLLHMSFSEGRFILKIFKNLPYQAGVFLAEISTSLVLLSLMYLTESLFPKYYPKKAGIFAAILLCIPLANALCLEQFDVLKVLSFLVLAVPYAVCLYVFARCYENGEPFNLLFGLGLLCNQAGTILHFAGNGVNMFPRYMEIFGYLFFSMYALVIITKDYKDQREKERFYTAELSKRLEDMQVSENAFLNAQMKPHFLYNTLNTIADCCVTDSEKAKMLINSLSEYLKLILSIDNMDDTVPLSHELELADAYTEIEKERFPSITFYKDVPEHLPFVALPPITLQPLIENAIKHGVRKSDMQGVITLRIIDNPEDVEFIVSDNGVGMDEETVGKLFVTPKENASIGIYNINKRLKYIYNSRLEIESTVGEGTSVRFTIRKNTGYSRVFLS